VTGPQQVAALVAFVVAWMVFIKLLMEWLCRDFDK
jgi:hypothetical protein